MKEYKKTFPEAEKDLTYWLKELRDLIVQLDNDDEFEDLIINVMAYGSREGEIVGDEVKSIVGTLEGYQS